MSQFSRLALARVKFVACLAWVVIVAVLYSLVIYDLPVAKLQRFYAYSQDFFLWQGLGALLLGVLAFSIRPGIAGRLLVGWLGLSTVVLLGFSSEFGLPIAFAVFILWFIAATDSMRTMIRCFVASEQATWGIGASILYGLMVPVMFFLCLFGLLNAWCVAALALAAALPAVVNWWRSFPDAARSIIRFVDSLNAVGISSLCSIWVFLALAFVWSNAPETGPDPTRRYVPYINNLINNQGFSPEYVFWGDLIPHAVQSIYAGGFVFGSPQIGKWLSWLSVAVLALVVGEEIARRSGQRDLGVLAGAGALACPLTLYLSTTLFIDQVVTLLCVAAIVSLFRGMQAGSRRGVLLSVFVMACAVQTKYNVLIFCVFWGCALWGYAIRRFGFVKGLKWLVVPVLLFAVVASPWYVYTFYTTGNPMFPWFNEIFKSPYWPGGRDLDFGYHVYSLGDSLWDYMLLPWTITFHSSRIDQGADGRLGFLLLALTPFVIFLGRDFQRNSIDLGVTGLFFVVAVCAYVPYTRYILPGYYLMLMSLFVALGRGVSRARLRFPRRASGVFFVCVFFGVLLPVPFFATDRFGLPWDVYVKTVSSGEWLAARFRGYPAIEEFNSIVDKDDFVLVTSYPLVGSVDGNAHVFPFWHLDINYIDNESSLASFFERNDARYWLVNFATEEFQYFENKLSASRYWSDSRLVAASSLLAAFDISGGESSRYSLVSSRVVPSVILPGFGKFGKSRDSEGWHYAKRQESKQVLGDDSDLISLKPGKSIGYLFSLDPRARLVRAAVRLEGKRFIRGALTFEWFDRKNKLISKETGAINARYFGLDTSFFGNVPSNAEYGRLQVSASSHEMLRVGNSRMDFLSLSDNGGGRRLKDTEGK